MERIKNDKNKSWRLSQKRGGGTPLPHLLISYAVNEKIKKQNNSYTSSSKVILLYSKQSKVSFVFITISF